MLTACLEAEQWNINVKTPMSQTRNGYLHNKEKGLACSARSFSDIPAMKKSSADKTRLVSLGGRPETGAIRVFNLTLEWLQLMRLLICFRFRSG